MFNFSLQIIYGIYLKLIEFSIDNFIIPTFFSDIQKSIVV
jgi:hypothetical protein